MKKRGNLIKDGVFQSCVKNFLENKTVDKFVAIITNFPEYFEKLDFSAPILGEMIIDAQELIDIKEEEKITKEEMEKFLSENNFTSNRESSNSSTEESEEESGIPAASAARPKSAARTGSALRNL